jgi:hypothetical protein
MTVPLVHRDTGTLHDPHDQGRANDQVRQARRRQSRAATAISGSHSVRSWTYTGLAGRPVPRRNAACPPLISAGTIRLSQASAFSATMTHT